MSAPVLVRPAPRSVVPPVLDADQRRVVEHPGGPLLVLAGPGTGKTTTLVEAVVDRVQRRGVAAESVLLLTFSRRAAQELRSRVTARLGGLTRGPVAMTFHGYAFALLRRELEDGLRLLSGPEHDLEVARLLAAEREDGGRRWPEPLREALPLRGFRQELRDLLLRAQERGLDGAGLVALGEREGRPAWVAAGGFLQEYEGRFDLEPGPEVLDHAGLVRAAAGLLESDPRVREAERAARAVVLVDEYQDTDPAQVRLLQALAGGGRDLIAVGDPDQAVYAFRGADVGGILRFPEQFPQAGGAGPAPVVALRTCRRSGAVLLAASRAVASRLPAGALGPRFRELRPDPAVVPGAGQVQVRLAPSPTAEAVLVADVLRRAHLVDGVPWSQMAVLVRSTARTVAVLRRALVGAGVPVGVAPEEVPLAEEPVVRALLDLLRVALRPEQVDEPAATALLTGPLVRADALAVRRLRRALRAVGPAGASSDDLLVDAVRDPRVGLLLPATERRPLLVVERLLEAVRGAAGGTAEDALWAAWSASRLERRLVEESRAGGPRGALADRALDGVLALFEAAARYVDRLPRESVLGFLDDVAAQEVPGDSLAQRTPDGEAVAVMTAHASKGLEWRVVVVAGVQEGVWPDLRLRGSLLGVEELLEAVQGAPAGEPVDRRAGLLADERRLFYVACTRARERLVLTAVAGGEGDDERPSRLLSELLEGIGESLPEAATPPPRPLTGGGLLAELRWAAAADPDPAVREAACRRLARLAVGGEDVPAVPAASPDRWWGLSPLSDPGPLVVEGEAVRVSPSRVEAFDACALRWLLTSAVGVAGTTGPAQVVGQLVHALAELASAPEPPSEDALRARLDAVLPALDLGAPWKAAQRRDEALAQLRKFLVWVRGNPRALVGTELDVRVPLPGLPGAVLAGRVDRLERDDAGRAVVVDLKTGSSKPGKDELARHPQLGAYQLAAALGAFAEHGLEGSGGAALLQLRTGKTAQEQPQQALADDPEPQWAAELVERVVRGMTGAQFPATAGDGCRTCAVRRCCPVQPEGAGVVR